MRTHRFEPVSLIFGVVFAGIGLSVLVQDVPLWRVDWSWFWPIALTVAGAAVLLSARPRRDEPQVPDAAVGEGEPQ